MKKIEDDEEAWKQWDLIESFKTIRKLFILVNPSFLSEMDKETLEKNENWMSLESMMRSVIFEEGA